MARDFLEIGPAPCDEECAQVGDPDFHSRAGEECRRFVELIRKKLGPEPEGATLRVTTHYHDFGPYPEVTCWYDDELPAAVDYAFRCESEAPTRWENDGSGT